MKGSINLNPCSPLTTRARRVCHANSALIRWICKSSHSLSLDVINRRQTKTILRYSNAIVRGKKKIQKLRVDVSSDILKNNLPCMRPPDRRVHRTQMAEKRTAFLSLKPWKVYDLLARVQVSTRRVSGQTSSRLVSVKLKAKWKVQWSTYKYSDPAGKLS